METDAASSNASSDSHAGSFCQTNLNYYSDNSFYFANSCKLDNYLVKKIENVPKKIEYSVNSKSLSKPVVNNINKKLPISSNSSECYSKKNSDDFSFRKFQTEFFNNNNNNCSVSDKQEINIQLNSVNGFGNKAISFSPDQVSYFKKFLNKSKIPWIRRLVLSLAVFFGTKILYTGCLI